MTSKQKAPTGPEGADVGDWRGYTQYRCTCCQFDTLSLAAFEDHYRLAHTSLETHEDERPAYSEADAPIGETKAED